MIVAQVCHHASSLSGDLMGTAATRLMDQSNRHETAGVDTDDKGIAEYRAAAAAAAMQCAPENSELKVGFTTSDLFYSC